MDEHGSHDVAFHHHSSCLSSIDVPNKKQIKSAADCPSLEDTLMEQECGLSSDSYYRMLKSNMLCPKTGKLYIFGYASLIWRPNFPFSRSWVGFIQGYERRFFQGTTTHRGTEQQPGRVATLITSPRSHERVWGVAFEVEEEQHIEMALKHLAEREMIAGGYRFDQVEFQSLYQRSGAYDPEDTSQNKLVHTDLAQEEREDKRKVIVQVYIAESGNKQFLGDAPLEQQAREITRAAGECGPNCEYLFKVCDFMRKEVCLHDPVNNDEYLFSLESLVRRNLEADKQQQQQH